MDTLERTLQHRAIKKSIQMFYPPPPIIILHFTLQQQQPYEYIFNSINNHNNYIKSIFIYQPTNPPSVSLTHILRHTISQQSAASSSCVCLIRGVVVCVLYIKLSLLLPIFIYISHSLTLDLLPSLYKFRYTFHPYPISHTPQIYIYIYIPSTTLPTFHLHPLQRRKNSARRQVIYIYSLAPPSTQGRQKYDFREKKTIMI